MTGDSGLVGGDGGTTSGAAPGWLIVEGMGGVEGGPGRAAFGKAFMDSLCTFSAVADRSLAGSWLADAGKEEGVAE
jgi:hypothetical protein